MHPTEKATGLQKRILKIRTICGCCWRRKRI